MTVSADEWAMRGELLGENNKLRGELLMTYQAASFGYKRVWRVEFIEVHDKIKYTHVVYELLDWAEQFALDRNCYLIPTADLTLSEYVIWYHYRPEALFKVLNHPEAAEFVKEGSCNLARYRKQVADICDAFNSLKKSKPASIKPPRARKGGGRHT